MSVGECARPRERRGAVERLREAEVEHLHGAVGPDLDVRGLEIAMHDAALVRGLERVGDLPRDRAALRRAGIGPCGDPLARASSPSTSSITMPRARRRCARAHRCARCSGDSATRASALRARSARRAIADRRRTTRAAP